MSQNTDIVAISVKNLHLNHKISFLKMHFNLNVNGYAYLTFHQGKKVNNVYLSKKSSQYLHDNYDIKDVKNESTGKAEKVFDLDPKAFGKLLLSADIYATENKADSELRHKLVFQTEDSLYASNSFLAELFGESDEITDFNLQDFLDEFEEKPEAPVATATPIKGKKKTV